MDTYSINWLQELDERISTLHVYIDEAADINDAREAVRLVYQIEALEEMRSSINDLMVKWKQSGTESINLAKAEACAVAKRLIELKPIYLGLEMIGMEDAPDIVELGVINHQGEVIIKASVRSTHEDWSTLSGDTSDVSVEQFTWERIWPEISDHLKDRFIVIYNGGFKTKIMKRYCEQHHLHWNIRDANIFCIMLLYAKFKKDLSRGNSEENFHNPELTRMQFDNNPGQLNRAVNDAQLAKKILHIMAEERIF